MPLRALAFGNLQPGQARAYRQVSSATPSGIESPAFSPLPGEEAGPDALALPSNESFARSGGLDALQNAGATGGGTSGAVPIAPTDDPNAYLNKIAELPGFQSPPTDEAPSDTPKPPVQSDEATVRTEQARGLQRLAGGEATTTDEASPAGQAIESVRKGFGNTKQAAGGLKSLMDAMNADTFQRPEGAFQAQRAGERTDFANPGGLGIGGFNYSPVDALPLDMASSPFEVGADWPQAGFESVPSESIPGELGQVGGDFAGALGSAGSGIQSAMGPLQLLSGLFNRNPFSAAMGGLQTGSTVSDLFGGPTISSYLSSLFPASGPVGAGAGGAGVAAGEGAAVAAPAVAEGGAAAGSTAAAGSSGLVGLTMAPFIIALTNWLMGQGPPNGKMADTSNIRRDFSTAYPRIQGVGQSYGRFGDLEGQDPEQQAETLRGILAESRDQRSQIPAISQFTSTQGGRHSGTGGEMLASFMPDTPGVNPVDVSGLEQQTPSLYMLAALNGMGAEDLLAQRGINPYEGPNGNGYNYWDTGQTLDLLSQQGQVDPRANPMTPEESAGFEMPGGRLQMLQQYFSRLNPDFGKSQLGQALAPFLSMPQNDSALANLAGVRGKIGAARTADAPRLQAEKDQALAEQYWRQQQGGGSIG